MKRLKNTDGPTGEPNVADLLAALESAIVQEVREQVLADLRGELDDVGYLHGWAAASAYTGIPESTLKRTDIPRFRVGDRVVFARSEIGDWLEQYRERRA